MQELAKQLSAQLGLDEATAAKVADYVAQNLDAVVDSVHAEQAGAADERDVPTDSPEDTPGRIDDDESWVLRQADSC